VHDACAVNVLSERVLCDGTRDTSTLNLKFMFVLYLMNKTKADMTECS